MDEGVTVLTVSAGSHQMGDGAINTSANTGLYAKHMTGGTRYQKFSNWKAQLVDSSIPDEFHIPEYLIRDEALIQAGSLTRSHLRQGLPASPDPFDPDNINHPFLGEYSNFHQNWWGTFNQYTGSVRAELYVAAPKTISPFIAIDETGRRVSDLAAREARMDLPILAGEGADKHVMEGLLLTMISQELGHRVVGLVRVGERRWDVVLTNGQRILLPEEQADQALERVIALDQAQDLLNRDISVVDMRQSNRPTVRMSKTALDNLRQIRMIEFEGINQ